MRKDFHVIFPIHAEMQSCADTEWNMSISEEGLHSLSCSEDEDRGELVCTGLIFI